MTDTRDKKSDSLLFSFGIFADAQYADKKSRIPRYYHKSMKKLKKCVNTFNSTRLDFIVNLGDLIDEGEQNLTIMLEICKKFTAPVYHILGNHDYNISKNLKSTIHELFSIKERYKAFTLNGWRILFLDGNELSFYAHPEDSEEHRQSKDYYQDNRITKPDWDGGISKQQLSWLEDQLTQAQTDHEHVMIFCHSPVYPDTHYALWNTPEVFAIIDRFPNVKGYFSGHNHRGAYAQTKQTHYVTFKGMVDSWRNSFAVVRVYLNCIQIQGFGRERNYTLKIV